MTGGGTVVHGADLTFSIVCDLKIFPSLDSVQQSYFWIHQGLLKAFKKLNIPAEILSEEKQQEGKFCFQAPCPGDLLLNKSKIAGGAQRRRGKILLHQGSIQISQISTQRDVLIQAILEAFTHTFELDLKERFDILSKIKNSLASLKQKYSSEAWTYKF
jgi:lipoate-protein ligase A